MFNVFNLPTLCSLSGKERERCRNPREMNFSELPEEKILNQIFEYEPMFHDKKHCIREEFIAHNYSTHCAFICLYEETYRILEFMKEFYIVFG